MNRSSRPWRRLAAAAAAFGLLTAVVGVPPAAAAPSVGQPVVTPPATLARGGPAGNVTVAVPTTEGATFQLSVSAPNITFTLPSACTTTSGVTISCTIVSGAVTIGDNGLSPADEPTTALFSVSAVASATIDLASVEGATPPAAGRTITAAILGLSPGATPPPGTAATSIVPGAGDAVVAISTSAPAGTPAVPRGPGSTVTYSANLARAGSTGQTTSVSVALVADAASGTSITGTNPQVVSFAPGETTKSATATVSVPASAVLGTATYHFVATYDPNGTDGTPTDTETGSQQSFTVVDGPNIAVTLGTSVPTSTELVRSPSGSVVTFTATATNSAAAGSAPATNLVLTFPTPTGTTRTGSSASGTASPGGVVDTTDPNQTTATFPSVSPGATAALTVTVTVNTNATKTSGPANDIGAGPASATWEPLNGSATSPQTFAYELRPEADLDMIVTDPPDANVGGSNAVLTADYSFINNGPDAANPPSFVAQPPSGVVGTPTIAFVTEADWSCGVNVTTKAVTCAYFGGTGSAAPLASGATTSAVSIGWAVNTPGSKSLSATVSSSTFDPVAANNTESQTVNVTSDPSSLAIDDVSVTEGNGGTTNAVFTITRTGATASAASVEVNTADASATAPSDYVQRSAVTVNFAPGQTTAGVTVTVNGDTTYEPDELFTVNLSNPSGATIGDAQGVGTILNDDAAPAAPTLSIDDVTVTEGDSGTTNAVFTVTRSGTLTAPSSVEFHTENGTAVASADFAHSVATLSFSAGQATRTVTIAVRGDTLDEADEEFFLVLANARGADIADGVGQGTITDDDDPPSLSVGDAQVVEGNKGRRSMEFTITLSEPVAHQVRVAYRTATDTAGRSDFESTSGRVTFAPGQTTATVVVRIEGDRKVEPDEQFTLTLRNPEGAPISDASGAGLIVNDD